MSHPSDIGIFGGDQRQVYMASAFLQKGYRVFTYRIAEPIHHENCIPLHNLNELFDKCSLLIGPIPLTRDLVSVASTSASELTASNLANLLTKEHFLIGGMIPSALVGICTNKGVPYYDLMKNEKITILNAIATAEGTIMEAIQSSNQNLHGSKCLVLGYGRCAKVLAGKLKGMDAIITVAARSEEALAYAHATGFQTIYLSDMKPLLPSYDFIFNTIPTLILDKSCLELVNRNVTIIDIASAPGGVDYEYAMQKKLKAKLCLGLPGKVAPKTSADILVNEIITLIKERSD
ncbi:MAG: dipicolinate synthase subunit DpsA [Herbinix sp.]|nr:dipicolinate synthase subunit DpsA [Herbinix sp.]